MSEIVGKWHGKIKKDKDKANALMYNREPEAVIMTTILAKVVFHTDVEAPCCNKN